MPRSDVRIFFSSTAPAFARPVGAAIQGKAGDVQATTSPTIVPITVNITGAEIAAQAGRPVPYLLPVSNFSNVTVGQTINMSQYWVDPNGDVITSTILNLDPAIWSYTHPILTAVGVGLNTGLQLQIEVAD